MDHILLEKEKKVAIVTINRPKALNALSDAVFSELDACFDALAKDEEIGAVIVTGAGEKAFVAGADIKELSALTSAAEAKVLSERGQAVFRKIEHFSKPVIAAVNGYALGGGCELALACHLRIAGESARFGLPEVSLGLIPGYGGTQRLARLIGRGRALEMALTGDPINAQHAYEFGLANHVVADADLMEKAKHIAHRMLSRGPLAVRGVLEAVVKGLEMGQQDGESYEAALFGVTAGSEDAKEGISAFLEKRKPDFKNR